MLKPFIQLLGTLIILISPLSNGSKTILFLIFWTLVFFPLNKKIILIFLVINIIFSIMDILSIQRGIFYFKKPDLLGLPYYEFLMWGFYLLHGFKTLGVTKPQFAKKNFMIWILVIGYILAFSGSSNSTEVFLFTACILVITLILFHEKEDWRYLFYFIFVGTLVEYLGVGFNVWGYPGSSFYGVPIWYLTMWGGVGLFSRRLIQYFVVDVN